MFNDMEETIRVEMKNHNAGARILLESETVKPEGIFTVSCLFTDVYFEAYRNNEKNIKRYMDACADAYFSASNIRLNSNIGR